MKKYISVIIVVLMAIALFWCSVQNDDPYQIDKFGSVWYATEDSAITVRRMNTDTEMYQIYLCYINNGVVEDYQKMGMYDKNEVSDGVDRAIEFYWDTIEY